MIDPKLNELSDDEQAKKGKQAGESPLTAEQRAARLKQSQAGHSINDTIARDANLSVGAQGVDTSGVRAGAGAGAGMTSVTPGNAGESPAPKIVPGARGSGTTPVADSLSSQTPTNRMDTEATDYVPAREEIAARAHQYWCERGRPQGSSEADWERAERDLRAEHGGVRAHAAKAR